MTGRYTVVFDASQTAYTAFGFPCFGLIFIAVGVLLFRFPNALSFRGQKSFERAFRYVFLGFSVLWTITALLLACGHYFIARTAPSDPRLQVVEGRVHDFRPMPYTGKGTERFCVADACFEYSDYLITAGFNNTAS